MTDQMRVLMTEELEQVGGGFEEVEHSQMTTLQAMSQQFSNMMEAADSVIRDISAR